MPDTNELEPCPSPNCDGTIECERNPDYGTWAVFCCRCGVTGPYFDDADANAELRARHGWNALPRNTGDTGLREALEKRREYLKSDDFASSSASPTPRGEVE